MNLFISAAHQPARGLRPRARRLSTLTVLTAVSALGLPLLTAGPAAADAAELSGGGGKYVAFDDVVTDNGQPAGGSCLITKDGAGGSVEYAGIGETATAINEGAMVFVGGRQLGGAVSQDGDRATFAPQTAEGGIATQLVYEALQDAPRLRVLATITNTSSSPVSVPVDYATNFGSDSGTTVVGTSSGDQALSSQDGYYITADAREGSSVAVNTTVFQGDGAPAPARTVAPEVFECFGKEGLLASFDVTVPAGETRSFLFFQGLSATPDEALQRSADYDGPLDPALLEGLSTGQRAQVVNFDLVSPTVTAELTPDPFRSNPVVSGTVTDAATSTVTVVIQDTAGRAATSTATVLPGVDVPYSVTFDGSTPDNDVSGFADGPVTVRATAQDAAGNTSEPATDRAVKDATAPAVTTSITPDPVTAGDSSIRVSGTVTDASTATVVITLSDSAGTSDSRQVTVPPGGGPYEVVFTASGFSDGTLTARATATDAAGGSSTATDTAEKRTAAANNPPANNPPANNPPANNPPANNPPPASPRPSSSPAGVGAVGSPSAAPAASTAPGCLRAAQVVLRETAITATGRAGLTVTASPGSVVDVFAYTRPSTTFRLVRSGTTDAAGSITFADLRPPANTRLRAQERGCAFGVEQVLNVRTGLSLNVERLDARSYAFAGRVLPARPDGVLVSLYRVTGDGRQVLTAQTRTAPGSGVYRIERAFRSSGRFGFVVRTGQDLRNAAGTSNVRSVLVF